MSTLATNSDTAPTVWRPPQGLQGLAALPVGGSRARAKHKSHVI